MGKIETRLSRIKANPQDVRPSDLCKIFGHYFGKPRLSGSSHRIYKTPWQGDPRVNIQNNRGRAKAYQARQMLKAIARLEVVHGSEK